MLAIALDAAMGSSWAACVGAGVALLLAAATTPLGPGLSLAGLAAGALGAALSRALGVEAPLGWLAAALAGGVLGGVTVERTRTHRWAPTAVASLLALSVLATPLRTIARPFAFARRHCELRDFKWRARMAGL